ncbi:hypothetical protein AZH46_07255 [Corynebacterium striatum]|nr:hypothetical protein AZH46_07255 [Corynebacterium striatum]
MANAWKYRKIAYYVVAALIFIALTTGIVTKEQLDGIVNTATIASGYLGTFALIFAGTKTHRGSDDKATKMMCWMLCSRPVVLARWLMSCAAWLRIWLSVSRSRSSRKLFLLLIPVMSRVFTLGLNHVAQG